jgi:hypothetical protein
MIGTILLLPGFTTHYFYHSPLTLGHVNWSEKYYTPRIIVNNNISLKSVIYLPFFFQATGAIRQRITIS